MIRAVSVVIPTRGKNEALDAAVRSVLDQRGIRTEILVIVSGDDAPWYEELSGRYAGTGNVRLLRAPASGVSAARNLGVREASLEGLLFLDEDDRLTPGCLSALAERTGKDIEFVQGRVTEDPDAPALSETDRAVRSAGGKSTKKSPNSLALFSAVAGKLFRTGTFREAYAPFDERLSALEDADFWLGNYEKLRGLTAFQDPDSREACLRRAGRDPAASPGDEGEADALFGDFLRVVRHAEEIIFDPAVPRGPKEFASNLAYRLNGILAGIFRSLPVAQRARVRERLEAESSPFLHKGLFSSETGIAFCHNFTPSIDPSAIVAPKRLREIEAMRGGAVNWTVISKDMSDIRSTDPLYDRFYSRFVYASHTVVRGTAALTPKNQYDFGRIAYQKAKDIDASVIYSRSMFPGSHVAAYLYKLTHENVTWYAEFSDPLLYNTDDVERISRHEEGDDPFLRDFWANVEAMVYEKADTVIFTNENQKRYMLAYNRSPTSGDVIEAKSVVSHHPVIDRRFTNVAVSGYSLPGGINIAYFGSLPHYRNREMLLRLLEDPAVHLHIFAVMTDDLSGMEHERVHLNDNVSYLEFLNLASRMDYLVVMDSENVSAINPWLPSKVGDYLASGTPILAIVKEGSTLSRMAGPGVITCREIDEGVVAGLRRKPAGPT